MINPAVGSFPLSNLDPGDLVEFQVGAGGHQRRGIVREIYRHPDNSINFIQIDHYMQNVPLKFLRKIVRKFDPQRNNE